MNRHDQPLPSAAAAPAAPPVTPIIDSPDSLYDRRRRFVTRILPRVYNDSPQNLEKARQLNEFIPELLIIVARKTPHVKLCLDDYSSYDPDIKMIEKNPQYDALCKALHLLSDEKASEIEIDILLHIARGSDAKTKVWVEYILNYWFDMKFELGDKTTAQRTYAAYARFSIANPDAGDWNITDLNEMRKTLGFGPRDIGRLSPVADVDGLTFEELNQLGLQAEGGDAYAALDYALVIQKILNPPKNTTTQAFVNAAQLASQSRPVNYHVLFQVNYYLRKDERLPQQAEAIALCAHLQADYINTLAYHLKHEHAEHAEIANELAKPRFYAVDVKRQEEIARELAKPRAYAVDVKKEFALLSPRLLELKVEPKPIKVTDSVPINFCHDEKEWKLEEEKINHYTDADKLLAAVKRLTNTNIVTSNFNSDWVLVPLVRVLNLSLKHDSLTSQAALHELTRFVAIIRQEIHHIMKTAVPLLVDTLTYGEVYSRYLSDYSYKILLNTLAKFLSPSELTEKLRLFKTIPGFERQFFLAEMFLRRNNWSDAFDLYNILADTASNDTQVHQAADFLERLVEAVPEKEVKVALVIRQRFVAEKLKTVATDDRRRLYELYELQVKWNLPLDPIVETAMRNDRYYWNTLTDYYQAKGYVKDAIHVYGTLLLKSSVDTMDKKSILRKLFAFIHSPNPDIKKAACETLSNALVYATIVDDLELVATAVTMLKPLLVDEAKATESDLSKFAETLMTKFANSKNSQATLELGLLYQQRGCNGILTDEKSSIVMGEPKSQEQDQALKYQRQALKYLELAAKACSPQERPSISAAASAAATVISLCSLEVGTYIAATQALARYSGPMKFWKIYPNQTVLPCDSSIQTEAARILQDIEYNRNLRHIPSPERTQRLIAIAEDSTTHPSVRFAAATTLAKEHPAEIGMFHSSIAWLNRRVLRRYTTAASLRFYHLASVIKPDDINTLQILRDHAQFQRTIALYDFFLIAVIDPAYASTADLAIRTTAQAHLNNLATSDDADPRSHALHYLAILDEWSKKRKDNVQVFLVQQLSLRLKANTDECGRPNAAAAIISNMFRELRAAGIEVDKILEAEAKAILPPPATVPEPAPSPAAPLPAAAAPPAPVPVPPVPVPVPSGAVPVPAPPPALTVEDASAVVVDCHLPGPPGGLAFNAGKNSLINPAEVNLAVFTPSSSPKAVAPSAPPPPPEIREAVYNS